VRLKRLSWSIAIKPPPFVESDKAMPIHLPRQPWRSTLKHGVRERFVIEQDPLIISDSFRKDTADSSYFIALRFTLPDQPRAFLG
jgi:hypothetical protein